VVTVGGHGRIKLMTFTYRDQEEEGGREEGGDREREREPN
jgi:hypothetical protein